MFFVKRTRIPDLKKNTIDFKKTDSKTEIQIPFQFIQRNIKI